MRGTLRRQGGLVCLLSIARFSVARDNLGFAKLMRRAELSRSAGPAPAPAP